MTFQLKYEMATDIHAFSQVGKVGAGEARVIQAPISMAESGDAILSSLELRLSDQGNGCMQKF